MSWVFSALPLADEVVVYGFAAALRRAATFSGDVLLSSDRCSGAKKLCKSR
jgi:hypothetical protein